MKEKNTISNHIPAIGKQLSSYRGAEIIDRLGTDVVKSVVTSILSGGNVRALTESLTRRRLNLSNAAMLMLYLECLKNNNNFSRDLHKIVANELKNGKLDKESRIFLNWFVGLTGKGIQNVLRSDVETFQEYISNLDASLAKSVMESKSIFGTLQAVFTDKNNHDYRLGWRELSQVFTAVGAQTLTIRGSEKSMYGKYFEKLVLGSLLTLLGFSLRDNETEKMENIFWLSERQNKRESDATVIYKPGVGARFDIGFIGPGNSEISLDKVSRFEREIEIKNQKHYMSTIILIDRIGTKSRITDMAKKIDGNIIQMSMTYWVKEVAAVLHNRMGFSHVLLDLDGEEGVEYINAHMEKIDLKQFVG
ncbi:MAG: CfrBI family restriction endonuclease [Treponema sp.]|nr:CfrBI family restriction endonuclease [Treponema sp.]